MINWNMKVVLSARWRNQQYAFFFLVTSICCPNGLQFWDRMSIELPIKEKHTSADLFVRKSINNEGCFNCCNLYHMLVIRKKTVFYIKDSFVLHWILSIVKTYVKFIWLFTLVNCTLSPLPKIYHPWSILIMLNDDKGGMVSEIHSVSCRQLIQPFHFTL